MCHDSPKLRMAKGQKLAALSPESNGRSPTMWQIELIENVTWCRSDTRTSPAQKKAVTAPCQLQDHNPPMRVGSNRLDAAM